MGNDQKPDPQPQESIVKRLHAPSVLLRETSADSSPMVRPARGVQGRYRVLGEIARGGVGVILKGHDEDIGRVVALKVLREEHDSHPDVVRRFVEEAQVGGQLQHPGVVPVYDIGINDDQRPFFAMKLVKGQTLAAILEDGPRQPGLLRIFVQVSETIAYAHSRRVIHRDIKPSNIVVGAYGEVQVVDWGFAKVLEDSDEQSPPAPQTQDTVISTVRGTDDGSVAGSVMGTPSYMPPEQALGQTDDLDARSDVFSLGAVLCEILTGEPPYSGGTQKERIERAARCDLDDATARLDACGADSDAIALAKWCLSPSPSDRPADARIVAERMAEIRASAAERTEAARVETAAAATHVKEERKQRRLLVVLGGAAIALLAVSLVAYIQFTTKQREREAVLSDRVRPLVERAEKLRGARDWDEARTVLAAAAQIAGSHDSQEWRDAVSELKALVDSEQNSERETAERDARESQLRAALRRAMDEEATKSDAARTTAAVDAALDAFGDAPLRGRPLAAVAAAALDVTAFLAPEHAAARWERAMAIDGDPWRTATRAALARGERPDVPDDLDDPRSAELAARLLIARGHHREAWDRLLVATRDFPGDFTLAMLCAETAFATYHLEAAKGAYTCARALRPRSVGAMRGLASCGVDNTSSLLERAAEAWPAFTELRIDRGWSLIHDGRFDEGRAVLLQTLKEHPGASAVRLDADTPLQNQDERDRALVAGIDSDEERARVLIELARIHERINRRLRAARYWELAWKARPDHPEYGRAAAELLLWHGRGDAARAILDQLGESPRLTLLRAGVALRMQEYEKADALLAQVPAKEDEPVEIARIRTIFTRWDKR